MHTYVAALNSWFEDLWTHRDATAIDRIVVENRRQTGVGQPRIGREAFRALHKALLALLDDIRLQIRDAHVEGDQVYALATLTATASTTGERVAMDGSVSFRVQASADGTLQIGDSENHWDFFSLFEQIGVLPEGTFERCLRGEDRPGVHAELARRAYRAFLTDDPAPILREIYAPSVAICDPGLPPYSEVTPDEIAELAKVHKQAFPNLSYDLTHVLESGPWVTVHFRIRGTHTGPGMGDPTDNPLDTPGFAIARFEKGRIVEVHQLLDRKAIEAAIGSPDHVAR